MPRPGYVRQPGAAILPRVVAAPARARPLAFAIAAGTPLLAGVAAGFSAAGFSSGVADFRDVALGPFAYVIPGLARDARNAAFYSETFRPRGVTMVEGAAMTFGQRAGQPFFHCHGLWTEADGKRSGGHMLPEETIVARDCEVRALGLDGAGYVWAGDSEINFTVPGPAAGVETGVEAPGRAFALRLRPNQDLCGAVEAFAAEHGVRRARIRGGVGSTIGALFTDGREAPDFATEVYVREGRVAPGPDGAPRATIDVGLIDFTGRVTGGVLARGQNPVLMTFELALEVA